MVPTVPIWRLSGKTVVFLAEILPEMASSSLIVTQN